MNAGIIKRQNAPILKQKRKSFDKEIFNEIEHIKNTKEVLNAIENIKATLHIEKKKGNPNADFILKRMR